MPFAPGMETWKHVATYRQLQEEASRYPGAQRVSTPQGPIWMTPIEAELMRALVRAGLSPVPQFCIQGYFVDFAFPEVHLAVEADGTVHDAPTAAEHDHRRDWHLGKAGWSVLRFHGATIRHRADHCAFVVHREVEERLRRNARWAEGEARARRARLWGLEHPVRALREWLRRGGRGLPPPPP